MDASSTGEGLNLNMDLEKDKKWKYKKWKGKNGNNRKYQNKKDYVVNLFLQTELTALVWDTKWDHDWVCWIACP